MKRTTPLLRVSAPVAAVAACLLSAGCGSGDGGGLPDATASSDGAAIDCPTHLEIESISTGARSDVGFTGFGHNSFPPAGGTDLVVETYDCEADCGSCKFRGPVPDNRVGVDQRQRCMDTLAPCSSDADCPDLQPPLAGPSQCLILRGPPQPSVSGTGVHSTTFYLPKDPADPASAVTGVIEFNTGEMSVEFNLLVGTYLGNDVQDCLNDATPYDGVKDGTCSVDTEVACDVHAISNAAVPYIVSLDCPDGLAVGFFDFDFGVSTATTTWILDSSRPDCTFGGDCYCGACMDGSACQSDLDCADGMGCGDAAGSVFIANSICRPDSPCDWDAATQSGTCTGSIPDAMNPGEFIDIPNQPCFPSDATPIRVSGSPSATGSDTFLASLAGLDCIPAASSAQASAQLGMPGPVVQIGNFRVESVTLP